MPISITKVESHNQHLGFDHNLFREKGFDPHPARQWRQIDPPQDDGRWGTEIADVRSYPFLPLYPIYRQGSIQLEISSGLKAGELVTSTPSVLPANMLMVVSFKATNQTTFLVESSLNFGSTWTTLETLSLPGSTTETRSYASDASVYSVRITATAVHASNKVHVSSQIRGLTLLPTPDQRPADVLPSQSAF